MPDLTVERVTQTGLNPTMTAAAASQTFQGGDKVFVRIANGDASSHNATFTTTAQVAGLDIDDRVVTVPAGEDRIAGPFPTSLYGSSVAITWSATTSMTIGVFSLP